MTGQNPIFIPGPTNMAMADLGYPVEPASGTRAAQKYYRRTVRPAQCSAA